jgi:hypothetical protein
MSIVVEIWVSGKSGVGNFRNLHSKRTYRDSPFEITLIIRAAFANVIFYLRSNRIYKGFHVMRAIAAEARTRLARQSFN